MPFPIDCPECDARLQVPDTLAGKRVKCKKCGESFLAKRPADRDDDDEEDAPARARRRIDDEEDDRPRGRRPRDDVEDEDERPRKRARDEDDDEDEPRPRKKGKKKKKQTPVFLFVAIGLGALAFIGGAVGLIVYLTGDKKPDTPVAQGAPSEAANATDGQAGKDGGITAPWSVHYDAVGRFRIKFPHQPTRTREKIQTPRGEVDSSQAMDLFANELFLATSEPVPEELRGNAEPILDGLVELILADHKGGGPTSKKTITHQGFPGREVVVSRGGQQGVTIKRIILATDRLINLTAGGPNASADAPKVKAFFESLQIE
jgi:predicted Zn finger-like uncharacterized protein